MRLNALAAFVGLLTSAAHADTMVHCGAAWKAMSAADKAATTYRAWSTTCLKKGYTVGTSSGGMTSETPPAGATAQCKDTFSMAKTAKGRCSGHGGVAKTL